MKERLTTLGLAIGALLLCYTLFLPKPHATDAAVPRPVTTEQGPAGYVGAWRWLQAEHVSVSALHERFDRLNDLNVSQRSTGNVLLTTLPHLLPLQPKEASQLDAWVERGNTLLVAAALDDTPQWAEAGSGRLLKEVERLSRLRFADQAASAPRPKFDSAEPAVIKLQPHGVHALMDGVLALSAISDLPTSSWQPIPMDDAAVLRVAQLASGEPAILIRQQGKGQVITVLVAGLFSNRDLGSADNAKLLSNILAWSLRPRASVIFDDMHQGVVGYYDAKKFFADPRLHRTLLWLVLVWLVFVLGVQRLRAPARIWRAADVTGFVGASGAFLASSVSVAAVGARLMSNFVDSLRRRSGAPLDDAGAWHWLASQPAVSAHEVAELQELQGRLGRGQRFDLQRLQDLISQLQGKI